MNNVLIELILVKGGTFQMGNTFGDGDSDECPVHEVTVNDFYMMDAPVTQKQWVEVMGNNPSSFEGDNNPVDSVSWDDVQEFIKKLNQLTGKSYRLPTEAEWEYAARSGGKQEKYAGTNDESKLQEYAWYGILENKTHSGKQKKPNGLGLYDMSGNVWEWCSDWYAIDYYKNSPKDNPRGPENGYSKVLRGGSGSNEPQGLRASYRFWDGAAGRGNFYGFRLVLPA